MKLHLQLFLLLAAFQTLRAQEFESITWLELKPNETISIKGDLKNGIAMPNLSWAWNSSVACFPQTQAAKFTGNHILYAFDLPSYSEMDIQVVPDDKTANFSLYAYEVGTIDKSTTVPNLSRCIRCEADHKLDYKMRGYVQDHTRRVKDILAIANPYQVLIGVTGANGLKEGSFTLLLKLKQ
jgi:hypothetical protein